MCIHFLLQVVFAPPTANDIFDSYRDQEDSDSDSDDDLLVANARRANGIDLGDGKILKQGFLMKKVHWNGCA